MGPIDYSLSVQQPFQSAVEGFKFGAGMKQMADERAALQAQQAAQQQMQQELAAASQDPRQLPGLMVRYPQLAEKLKIGWDTMNGQQQQASLAQASEVFSALHSGRADVAQANLRSRAQAMRDAGDEQGATLTERMAQWAETHPESLKTSIGLRLAAIPGGEKVIEAVTKLGGEQRAADLHPALVEKGKEEAKEAGSKATTEAVKAKYAESTALKDLEVKGWNIKNIKSEIGYRKESNRIAAMNAAANREGNALKRQELQLKINEAQSAIDSKAREKVADVQSAVASMDNLINTVDRLKKNPGLRDVLGSIEGNDYYPTQLAAGANVLNPFTSSGDDRADAIAIIDTLKSQAFLAMVPGMKGLGQLSNAEGEKLQSGLQNLSRKQSESQFNANLDEVQRLILKARKNVETRYGIKAGAPDTPAVSTSPAEVDALVKKYGGGG